MIKAIKKVFQKTFALRRADKRYYLYAIFGPALMIVLSIIISEIVKLGFPEPEVPPGLRTAYDIISGPPTPLFYYILFSICIVAPLIEEVIFRGILWRLGERFIKNDVYILAITSILFALAHSDFYHIIGVFPIGLYIGWLRMRSGSIYPSILAHAVNNFLVSLILMI